MNVQQEHFDFWFNFDFNKKFTNEPPPTMM